MGRAEELGSGVKKLYKYCKAYTGFDPVISDEDIFKIAIPIHFDHEMSFNSNIQTTAQDSDQDKIKTDQDSDQDKNKTIINFCKEPKTLTEIMQVLNYKNKTHFRINILNQLIEKDIIKLTIPDKPTSKNQKYYSSEKNEV